MSKQHTSVLILGSGPAGYTAAIYAARAMLRPILLTGLQKGGQLTITTDVENYPGFPDPINGPWLVEQMALQAQNMGAQLIDDLATSVDLSQHPFQIKTDYHHNFTCDALIIATGASARWLGLESEETFLGGGVSACATCDGFFYRNQDVIVVGGGNTALEEALYLSHIAKNVTIVHRRDHFRAEKILQHRIAQKENIHILWDHEVIEIFGTHSKIPGSPPEVTSVLLKDTKTQTTETRATSGVFIAIGHSPCVDLFKGQLKQKDNGYLWTYPDSTRTNIDGVFAAGDVADDVFRQAVTAAGRGCMAALEAEKWLSSLIVND